MRNHRIYINATELSYGKKLSLDKDTSHYINTVLRLKSGYQVNVFNGDGNEYRAITHIDRKNCSIEIIEKIRTEKNKNNKVHLIQAIARGDHMDFAIQKATELDVDEITPVISERTQNHDKARLQKRFAHWQKIVIHASEQCGRCYLPVLNTPVNFEIAMSLVVADSKFICHPGTDRPQALTEKQSIAVIVGPEGGLNDKEIELARTNGYKPLSLGKNVLRTETAATSALTLIHYLL